VQSDDLYAQVSFRRDVFGAVAEDFAAGGVVATGEAAHAAEGAGEVYDGAGRGRGILRAD